MEALDPQRLQGQEHHIVTELPPWDHAPHEQVISDLSNYKHSDTSGFKRGDISKLILVPPKCHTTLSVV